MLFITESFWMNTCKMTSVYAHSRRITTKGAHGYLVCKMKENKEAAKGREKPVRCGWQRPGNSKSFEENVIRLRI